MLSFGFLLLIVIVILACRASLNKLQHVRTPKAVRKTADSLLAILIGAAVIATALISLLSR